MNKNKALFIIDKLIKNINLEENESEELLEQWQHSKMYIDTWVIGSLKMIKNKIEGNLSKVYPTNATYKDLFKNFLSVYMLERVEPSIKIYCCMCLYDIENRNLIISLFENIFSKKERDQIATKINYIPYSQITNKKTKYYIIERTFTKNK